MRKAFYITSYNDPEACERLMVQLSSVPGLEMYELFLSDQSAPEYARVYDKLCSQHGYTHLSWENKGATASKRKVVEHASENGFAFLSQISEDFSLTDSSNKNPAFVSGHSSFLKDATLLLYQLQEIPFVHWTCIRGKDSFGYLPAGSTPRGSHIRRLKGMQLSYYFGDVALWNWPYTGRVQEVLQIWRRGEVLVPGCEDHRTFASWGGGEWRQQWVSQGQGACLLAHPVRHPEQRDKPQGSLP
jgi:hypothetical protein